MAKTSTGLEENIAGLLCYVLGWVSGIVFLIIEKENNFVKFHAIQSIIVFGVLTVASAVFGWIPVLGIIIRIAIGILGFILWLILIIKAGQGERYKVKWAGAYAEKWAK